MNDTNNNTLSQAMRQARLRYLGYMFLGYTVTMIIVAVMRTMGLTSISYIMIFSLYLSVIIIIGIRHLNYAMFILSFMHVEKDRLMRFYLGAL